MKVTLTEMMDLVDEVDEDIRNEVLEEERMRHLRVIYILLGKLWRAGRMRAERSETPNPNLEILATCACEVISRVELESSQHREELFEKKGKKFQKHLSKNFKNIFRKISQTSFEKCSPPYDLRKSSYRFTRKPLSVRKVGLKPCKFNL